MTKSTKKPPPRTGRASKTRSGPSGRELLDRWRQSVPADFLPPDPAGPRGRILVAARETFAAEGFDSATTRAIADRAEANLAMVHYYFGSKEALYHRVLGGEIVQVFLAMAESVFAGERAALERLLDLVGFINRSFRRDPVRLGLIRREIAQGAPHVPAVVESLGSGGPMGFREVVLATIREGQGRGEILKVDPGSILAVLLANAYGLLFAEPMVRIILGPGSLDDRHWEEILTGQREMLRRALSVGPEENGR